MYLGLLRSAGALGASDPGKAWLTSGWSFPEDWGVWSTGTDSVLTIPVPRASEDMTLELQWFAAQAGIACVTA